MTTESLLIVVLALLAIVTVIGIFATKTKGFGRYSTSLVLLSSALFLGALFLAIGKIEGASFMNILFAVAGYAGGLIAPSKETSGKPDS